MDSTEQRAAGNYSQIYDSMLGYRQREQRATDERMRRSDLFSFDHKRVETKVIPQSERLDHPVVSRGANAHGTANTSHSILRNIGPIQESKLGTKR